MKRPRAGTRMMQDASTATTGTPRARPVAQTSLDWVLPVSVLRRGDVARSGLEGAILGDLGAAGVDVPPGFVVGTAAFSRFIEAAGLQGAIATALLPLRGALAGGSPPSPATFEHVSRQIQAAVQAASMPEAMAQSIRDAYVALCRDVPGATGLDVPVVVAVSSFPGDVAQGPDPGQQETYLNVCGPDAVVERVKACWTSLYAPRALACRPLAGFASDEAGAVPTSRAAVLVQRMVPSDSAGVCSTREPVSGDPARIVVESTWGLGDALVSGRVRPDRFIVDRKTLAILERHISRKTIEHVPRPDRARSVEQAVHPSRQAAPSMTDEEVSRVAESAIRIEQHLGTAQEIEFAIEFVRDMRRIRVVRARPQTGGNRTPASAS